MVEFFTDSDYDYYDGVYTVPEQDKMWRWLGAQCMSFSSARDVASICSQRPCLAQKAIALLRASLLRSSTLFWSECTNTFDIFRMLLRVIQSVILKGEFEGGSRKLASGTSGREMGWQRIKSEN